MTILLTVASTLLFFPVHLQSQSQHYDASQNYGFADQPLAYAVPVITPNSGIHKTESNPETHTTSNEKQYFLTDFYYLAGILSFLVGVGTFFSVRNQTKALKNMERAHVDIDLVPSGLGCHVRLSNYGKSIAYVMEYNPIVASFRFGTDDLDPDKSEVKWEDFITTYSILPPGTQQHEFLTHPIYNVLPKSAYDLEHDIIVSGLVTYKDIFGDEHRTEVVYRYRYNGDKIQASLKVEPRYGEYT